MPGVSIHVVDVSRGVVATGLRVALFRGASACTATAPEAPETGASGSPQPIAEGLINASGLLDDPALADRFQAGYYEAVFHVGEFYDRLGAPGGDKTDTTAAARGRDIRFLDVVTYRFGIHDPAQHFHLPFKMTPWGYSCFRGGA